MARLPDSSPATAATAALPVSTSRSACRAGPISAAAAGVTTTRRPRRWKRAVPSSVSNSLTASDRAGWEMDTALAAAVNPWWSATAKKCSSLRRSIYKSYQNHRYSLFDFFLGIVQHGMGGALRRILRRTKAERMAPTHHRATPSRLDQGTTRGLPPGRRGGVHRRLHG